MRTWIKLLLPATALLMAGCKDNKHTITSLDDLKGGRIFAVPTGTFADQFVKKRFPDAKLLYYNTVLDCALEVQKGKADAAAYDRPVLLNIAAKNEGLTVLPGVILDDHYGFAVRMEDKDLKEAADQVLDEIKANGTYQEMLNRWFPESGPPAPMPEIPMEQTEDVLRFGTSAVTEPMSFKNGRTSIVGFDIEFATYIAKRLHKRLEILDMEFGAMIPALVAGKVDMIGACLSITEERAKKVLFTKSYYDGGLCALVKKPGQAVEAAGSEPLYKVEDIGKMRIGVLLGSIHDAFATKTYPGARIQQYQTISDMLVALNSEKVEVAFYDDISLRDVFNKNSSLGTLKANVFTVPIAAGFNKESTELRQKFDAFLSQIKADGIYNDMEDRWMRKYITTMPALTGTTGNGSLRVGVVSDLGMPFTILQNGKLAGFDIELASRFALSLHKEFVPVEMPFGSLIAAISTQKIDMICASMMITEERKKKIDFSTPYYESGVSIIARKANIPGQAGSETAAREEQNATFLDKFAKSFYNNIILEKRYLLIIDGLGVTILISVFAAILGSIFGGIVCFMRMSAKKYLSVPARLYISLLRGMPVLVLLMIIYYVVFASLDISPVIVAILSFALNFAAYVSEMFRTSIQSISKGQTEAGIALGFTRRQTFLHIILPQALRHVLPVYKGEFISMMKMTSIVGYIAVQDLTKAGDIIRSRTFDAFFPLIMAAVIYLFLAWLLTLALSRIEVSVDPKTKRLKRVKEARQ